MKETKINLSAFEVSEDSLDVWFNTRDSLRCAQRKRKTGLGVQFPATPSPWLIQRQRPKPPARVTVATVLS